MLVLTLAATVTLAWGASAQAQVQSCPSDGVITSGGVYSGCVWERTQDTNPAVTVKTAQAVTIESSTVKGKGDLIKVDPATVGADVTVRNVTGEGLNPDEAGKQQGRFVDIRQFKNARVENNLLENTAGIYLNNYRGDGSAAQSVKVLRNRAKNTNGMKSDGAGGYDKDATYEPIEFRSFVQLGKVRHVAGMEVAWNEVINEPGRSKVEDNINFYLSSGTSGSPVQVHDNFIWGAYPPRPDSAPPGEDNYTGSGMNLGDQGSGCPTDSATTGSASGECPTSADDTSAYVEAHDNQVVGSGNAGIAIPAGHDSRFFDNRIVASGKFKTDPAKMMEKSDTGTANFAKNRAGGVIVFNYYNRPGGTADWSAQTARYYNNYAYDNQNATMQHYVAEDGTDYGLRRAYDYVPGCAKDASGNSRCYNNMTSAGGPIDKDSDAIVYYADEVNEYDYWKSKLASSGTSIGPVDNTAPTVASVTPPNGKTGVNRGGNVTAAFLEAMDPDTVNTSTVKLVRRSTGAEVPAMVTYDPATKRATLNPDSRLAATSGYEARVTTGAKDAAGNALAADKVWTFRTGS